MPLKVCQHCFPRGVEILRCLEEAILVDANVCDVFERVGRRRRDQGTSDALGGGERLGADGTMLSRFLATRGVAIVNLAENLLSKQGSFVVIVEQEAVSARPSLENMEERPIHNIFKVLWELEHPDRAARFAICEAEPVLLGLARAMSGSVCIVEIPSESQCAFPLGVVPLAILELEFGVVHPRTGYSKHSRRDMLEP